MRTPRHGTASTAVAIAVSLALVAQPAYADMFGGDLPLLGGLIVQTTQTVATLADTLTTLRKSYEEAKRVAGYADDAYRAFQAFQHYNAELFAQDIVSSLETAYPDVGYFRRELSGAGPWARGSGELQRLVRLCVGGPLGSCGEFQEALSYRQTREALAATFGLAPEGAHDLAAVDHETAVALAAGSAQQGRSERARQLHDSLMKQCQAQAGKDAASIASCQAAAASAEIEALRVQADIADQIALGNRLLGMQLQLKNQDRKRELLEAEQRRTILLQSAEHATERPAPVEAEGFNLLEGSAP